MTELPSDHPARTQWVKALEIEPPSDMIVMSRRASDRENSYFVERGSSVTCSGDWEWTTTDVLNERPQYVKPEPPLKYPWFSGTVTMSPSLLNGNVQEDLVIVWQDESATVAPYGDVMSNYDRSQVKWWATAQNLANEARKEAGA